MRKLALYVLFTALVLWLSVPDFAYTGQEQAKNLRLPRASLEQIKLSPRYLHDLLNELEEEGIEMHSLMVSSEGKVVFEGFWNPYGPDSPISSTL